MEAIFTLPYSEYAVATLLQKNFKKSDGYSIQIPLSRQQKGIDLLIYNQKTKKAISIQVKSSRSWYGTPSKTTSSKEKFQYYSWFNNFDYERGIADFYVFFILYPKNSFAQKRLDKTKDLKKWWDSCMVTFNDKEIELLLKNLKTKEGKPESFFGFGFNEKSKDIYITRGFKKPVSYKKNLIENKMDEMKKRLK